MYGRVEVKLHEVLISAQIEGVIFTFRLLCPQKKKKNSGTYRVGG